MKKIYSFFIVWMIVVSLFASRTWMIYMGADNNLSSQALADINQMEMSGPPLGDQVIIQFDGRYDAAKRYRLQQDNDPNNVSSLLVENIGEIDSGDWHELTNFIQWTKSRYPNDEYFLILWSHGNGWRKDETPLAWKSIFEDNNPSGSTMSVAEGDLNRALTAANVHFSAIIYDACLMQTIETAYQLRDHTDYIVASPDLVPGTGYPYDDIFAELQTIFTTPEAVSTICTKYAESYAAGGSQNESSVDIETPIAAIKTEHFSEWEFAFQLLATALQQACKQHPDVFESLRSAVHTYYRDQTDLMHLLDLIQENQSLSELDDVIDYFREANQLLVFQEDAPGNAFSGPYSLWFPDNSNTFEDLWSLYRQLDFVENGTFAWHSFLASFLGLTPDQPEIVSASQFENSYEISCSLGDSPLTGEVSFEAALLNELALQENWEYHNFIQQDTIWRAVSFGDGVEASVTTTILPGNYSLGWATWLNLSAASQFVVRFIPNDGSAIDTLFNESARVNFDWINHLLDFAVTQSGTLAFQIDFAGTGSAQLKDIFLYAFEETARVETDESIIQATSAVALQGCRVRAKSAETYSVWSEPQFFTSLNRSQDHVLVYPNPFFLAKDPCVIFRLPNESNRAQLRIFSMNGEEQDRIDFENVSLLKWQPTSHYDSGLYYFLIYTGNQSYSGKFSIIH